MFGWPIVPNTLFVDRFHDAPITEEVMFDSPVFKCHIEECPSRPQLTDSVRCVPPWRQLHFLKEALMVVSIVRLDHNYRAFVAPHFLNRFPKTERNGRTAQLQLNQLAFCVPKDLTFSDLVPRPFICLLVFAWSLLFLLPSLISLQNNLLISFCCDIVSLGCEVAPYRDFNNKRSAWLSQILPGFHDALRNLLLLDDRQQVSSLVGWWLTVRLICVVFGLDLV